MEERRIGNVFRIIPGGDVPQAKAALERTFAEDERILAGPPPAVAVLAPSGGNVGRALPPSKPRLRRPPSRIPASIGRTRRLGKGSPWSS